MSTHNHRSNTSIFRPSSALRRSSTVHTTSTNRHGPSRLNPAYDTVLRQADRDIFGASSSPTTTSRSRHADDTWKRSYRSDFEQSLKRSNAIQEGGHGGPKKSWGPTNSLKRSWGPTNSFDNGHGRGLGNSERFHSPPTASRSREYLPGTSLDLGSYAGGAYGSRSSSYGASSSSRYSRQSSMSSASSTYRPGPGVDLSSTTYDGGYGSYGLSRSKTSREPSSYSRIPTYSSEYY
jgi:hypothetical protein